MKYTRFALQPFCVEDLPDVKITGSIGCDAGKLEIRYELQGPSSQIVIPAGEETPGRRDELWKNTCFEFFLAPKNSDIYWEFNLSPSGSWNIYRFSSYRQGMREEKALETLPFVVEVLADSLFLSLEADISRLFNGEQTIGGIATILELTDSSLTYWSLKHPGRRPDFHLRDGFILEL
jgi:hypothetical protein